MIFYDGNIKHFRGYEALGFFLGKSGALGAKLCKKQYKNFWEKYRFSALVPGRQFLLTIGKLNQFSKSKVNVLLGLLVLTKVLLHVVERRLGVVVLEEQVLFVKQGNTEVSAPTTYHLNMHACARAHRP